MRPKTKTWMRDILIALCCALLATVAIHMTMRAYVLHRAELSLQNLILSHRALHQYIQKVMHPTFYRARDEGMIAPDYYAPEIFSSSYIVRVMHGFYNEELARNSSTEIYYKLAANNPRNPLNRADPAETELIAFFNEHRDIRHFDRLERAGDRKYLYYAIPFLENNSACLRCHGRREDAPPGLQARYPGEGGFNETVGTIRAIESIRVPLRQELGLVGTSAVLAGITASTLAVLFLFNQRLKADVSVKTHRLVDELAARQATECELRRQTAALEKSEAGLRHSLHEKEALLREIHHRVKNNLQVISSLLHLESDRLATKPATEVLRDIDTRILSMALLHERVYRTGTFACIDTDHYLPALARQVVAASAVRPGLSILIKPEMTPLQIELAQAVPLGLIVTELVTNAVKHAFPTTTAGTIRLALRPVKDSDEWCLLVADDGIGLPPGLSLQQLPSLGLTLVGDLARQIGGRIELRDLPRAEITLVFVPSSISPPNERPDAHNFR